MVSAASASQLKRFLKGFLVYLALGSPIGAVAFWLEYIVIMPWHGLRWLLSLPFLLPLSYILGLVPSAIVGAIVAFLNVRYRGLNWAHVAAISLLPGLAAMLWTFMRPDPYDVRGPDYLGESWEWTLICLVPTLACWRIVRRWRIQPEGV
jgi:hypothetical protein